MTNRLLLCCGCKQRYQRDDMLHGPAGYFHDIQCARDYQRAKNDKAERKDTRARKAALLTARDWIKKVQPVFNKYIRIRDKDRPCISCGRTNEEVQKTDGWKTGGAWDCGHYLSVGAHPELRFDSRNASKQCKSCNGGSGKYAGKNHTVTKEYRIRLIAKIGINQVLSLEGPHPPKKYTVDQLKELKARFTKLIKELPQ